jgi:hypothetical protein
MRAKYGLTEAVQKFGSRAAAALARCSNAAS